MTKANREKEKQMELTAQKEEAISALEDKVKSKEKQVVRLRKEIESLREEFGIPAKPTKAEQQMAKANSVASTAASRGRNR